MLREFLSLVKPRIVALLSITGASGLFAAGGAAPTTLLAFLAAGAAVAGGAAALNCWYDRDLDRHMDRTADRPLPSGRLSSRAALAFALGLLVVGTGIGLAALPRASVAYMLLGALSYVGLYTVLLKRRHPIGVVLGGSAGSFPVLAGWTAVRPVAAPALAMAALVFAWTPAHAWALAFVYRDDFAAADVATLPAVVDPETTRQAVWLSALAAVAAAAAVVPFADRLYLVALLVAAPPFLLAYRGFRAGGTDPEAVRAFFTSNLFLAVLFVAWAADGLLRGSGTLAPGAALLVPALFVGLWNARPALRGIPAAVGGEWRSLLRRVRSAVRASKGNMFG